jgi:hypothetical protein
MQAVAAGTGGLYAYHLSVRIELRRREALLNLRQNARLSVLTVGINPRASNTGNTLTTHRRALSCSLAPGCIYKNSWAENF